ncbi:MAG: hypothetical protein HY367_02410 [Candidatus Aenigmarchaeota archaeon]|nr:hypothetical protein [Candidatus Aenigmarchaeota archaeon]
MFRAKRCESCGSMMYSAAQHAMGNAKSPYCIHCTTPDGKLKRKKEVAADLVKHFMKAEGLAREDAEYRARRIMVKQPAWKKVREAVIKTRRK